MRVVEVYVELSIKKSQDFQSCHNAVGLRAALESGDNPEAIVGQLQAQCHKLLLKKLFSGQEGPVLAQAVAAQ